MTVAEQSNKNRRVKRNTWLLIAVAVGVYVAFIAAGVLRSQGGA
ncbi:MAG: hypothetical protein AB8F65_13510 [Woeseiaceae bacterium]